MRTCLCLSTRVWVFAFFFVSLHYIAVGQINIGPSAVVSHTSGGSGQYAPSLYNDGIIGPDWGWTTSNGSILFEWSSIQVFDAVVFHKANRPMSNCEFQYWDGTDYITFYEYNDTSGTNPDTISFLPIASSRLRFHRIAGSGNPNFTEIEVFQASTTDNDAGVSMLISPTAFCPGTEDIIVRVQNYGSNEIDSVWIDWSLDGTAQNGFWVLTTLDSLLGNDPSFTDVVIGSQNFVADQVYELKVWTVNPNNEQDTINFNDTLEVSVSPALSGNYVVNSSGSGDFNSFSEIISQLNSFGVCGPVEIDVVAGSGPYNEQFTVEEIPGASSVNTITIKGNGNTLEYDNSAEDYSIIRLQGTDHFVLDSLNIRSLSSSYGWGVHFTASADSNVIRNCIIDMSSITSTSVSNSGGIIMSGSRTSVTATGNNASHNLIENNHIIGSSNGGAYSGIVVYGENNPDVSVGNVIRNNEVSNFYLHGIRVSGAANTVIDGNIVSRADRVNTGIVRAVYTTLRTDGLIIKNNNISNLNNSAVGSTSSTYLISHAGTGTRSNPVHIFNNLLHSPNGGGTQYAAYNTSPWVKFHHNTIVLNDKNAATQTTYGFYTTTASNDTIELYNNIFYMNRNTTGLQYGIRVNTSSLNDFRSDNNVFYLGNNAGLGYRASGYTSLADWTAAFGDDANSAIRDPFFVDIENGNLIPRSGNLKGIGRDLRTEVPEDILGQIRPQVPDPGAYQFDPAPCGGVYDLVINDFEVETSSQTGMIEIEWKSASDEWIVMIGDCNQNPDSLNPLFVDSNVVVQEEYGIHDLPLSECYCLYVKEICDDDEYGVWSDPLDFCTYVDHDVELTAFVNPTDSSCGLSTTEFWIEVTNLGLQSVTSLPVEAHISGDYNVVLTSTYSGAIPQGESQMVKVGAINAYVGGRIDLTTVANLPNDQNNENDTISVNDLMILSSAPLRFETSFVPNNGTIEFDFSSSRNDADSIHWDFAGLGSDYGEEVSFEFPRIDSFEVCMTVFSHCNPGTVCQIVYTDTVPDDISTTDFDLEKNVRLYPNPTSGRFTLSFEQIVIGDIQLSLVDIRGKRVFSEALKDFTGYYQREYDYAHLQAGVYILMIQTQSGVVNKRIVIQ